MTQHDPTITLRQMLEHAEIALQIGASRTDDEILDDLVAWHAHVRVIEVIGEAARRLDPEERANHAGIPWSEIIATRNFLAHGYDHIDPSVLFRILRDDIPALAVALREVLHD